MSAMHQREVKPVPASVVRDWARRRGLTVGQRGHLPTTVIEAFNRRHPAKHFDNRNPFFQRGAA